MLPSGQSRSSQWLRCYSTLLLAIGLHSALAAADYFPPPESEGGWRSIAAANAVPTADQKEQILASSGIDWDKLKLAWDYDLSVAGAKKCLVVIRHGWIAGEWFKGPSTTEGGIYYSASGGKSYFGPCFARLFDQSARGELSKTITPESYVYQYMPSSWSAVDVRRKQIKIKHILTMTSGLKAFDGPYDPATYYDIATSLPVLHAPRGPIGRTTRARSTC